MKRGMYFTLVGFGALTVSSGIFLAVTFAADWVHLLHFFGAGILSILTIVHIWKRRKSVRGAA